MMLESLGFRGIKPPLGGLGAWTLRAWRLLSFVLFLVLSFPGQTRAQQLILPEVELQVSALSEQDRARLSSLSDKISYSLQNYQAPTGITRVPKHPMRLSVRVVFRPELSVSGEYLSDRVVIAYRPVYDSEQETIVFSAIEEGVSVSPMLLNSLVEGNSELPSESFLLRLHHLATLSLLMYYDSFEVNGGEPFLDALLRNASFYQRAYDETSSGLTGSVSPWALTLPEELTSEWGKTFRELWMLFHLEAIDTSLKDKGNDESFVFSLKNWASLGQEGHIRGLMRLLSDTKRPDVERLLGLAGERAVMESRESADYLFPGLGGR